MHYEFTDLRVPRSFDGTQEKFRADPTLRNASAYLTAALEYWNDDMIGDDTFVLAIQEVAYSIKEPNDA